MKKKKCGFDKKNFLEKDLFGFSFLAQSIDFVKWIGPLAKHKDPRKKSHISHFYANEILFALLYAY